MMHYYCAYTWYHHTTMEQVDRVIVEHAEAGRPGTEMIRGYYGLVGGGAGFLILETDDPREVNAFLRPLLPLMRWDVRAIIPLDFEEDLGKLRQMPASDAGLG